jgi:hypothetical protein
MPGIEVQEGVGEGERWTVRWSLVSCLIASAFLALALDFSGTVADTPPKPSDPEPRYPYLLPTYFSLNLDRV